MTQQHPGAYVREHVLPEDMNVTRAAALLEVSRPALSNLLNGNADLSPEMAARLEAAFGVPARTLLDLQSAWDAAQAKRGGTTPVIRAYVPPFLQIKAARIEQWASTGLSPRQRLAVFLRILVNSTGIGLSKSDFPGNDSSERHGWDGETVADAATPWIPAGHTGWEFGTNENVKGKADHDFGKSVEAMKDAKQRAQMTFVFVTPRNWSQKEAWVKEQQAKKLWKEVRAYDATDLEQWLEQSLPAQTWFANETQQAAHGALSLDQAWKVWAADCEPALSPALFADAIPTTDKTLRRGLTETPYRPITITADSKDEALGFLSAAFDADRPEFGSYRDRVIVFREPGALSKLAAQITNFIPVITSREVELEFAPFRTSMPSFIVYPRNATADEADILLESVSYETFNKALEAMDVERDAIDQLNRESGRSLTVLRRRLSKLTAVKTPGWAGNSELARNLVPFMFAGAWKIANVMDQTMLEALAGEVPYDELERRMSAYRALDGSPMWAAGGLAGVVSKIDALFAVRDAVTAADLERFFVVAHLVLGENDPALELPEKDRWAAGIHGKTRQISGALRSGLAETLVLLAVHGRALFADRLGANPRDKAAHLVRTLLTPMTAENLESQVDNLSLYAEAAPEVFLSLIEEDLRSSDSASLELMRPMSDPMFSRTPRTGLLWALEGLAWSRDLFMRTVLVLAKLAERKLDDNLSNKPINSLSCIFRSWMPQTSVPLEAREAALTKLAAEHPDVAWPLCLEQFSPHGGIGHYTHKPRWRSDAHGYGEPVSGQERNDFAVFAFKLAVAWPNLTVEMLKELLGNLGGLAEDLQLEVWDRVDAWVKDASEGDKAVLRERIRVVALSRRARRWRGEDSAPRSAERARALFERMLPSDPVLRHGWLFEKPWIEESPDEIEDEHLDYNARAKRIDELRQAAVSEVIVAEGVPGLMRVAELGEAHHILGWTFATVTTYDAALLDAVVEIVGSAPLEGARLGVVMGTLSQAGDKGRAILSGAADRVPAVALPSLLTAAPFDRSTWRVLDTLPAAAREAYWRDVRPGWTNDDEDLVEGTTQLLGADRPRAAFQFAHYKIGDLPPHLLFDLMQAITMGSSEAPNTYLLDRYHLHEAFKALSASGDFSTEQIAGLEYQFIDIFGDEGQRPEHLEKALCESPELFVQMCAFAFKRSDDGVDPPELIPASEEQKSNRAHAAYHLLKTAARIPGTDKNGVIDQAALEKWIADVRAGCGGIARQDIGDQMIGQLLSHAPAAADEVWPCVPVREALEHLITEQLSRGLEVALYNSRGVHSRGPGGSPERALAAKYGGWAQAMEFSHPRVAAMLRDMELWYTREAEREDQDAEVSRRLGR